MCNLWKAAKGFPTTIEYLIVLTSSISCVTIPQMGEIYREQSRQILEHTETYTLDRAFALRQILARFGLPFRFVAGEGAQYPDGDARVSKGEVFVTYDTGDIPSEVIWRMVEEIAPTPMVDGKR